MTSARIRHVLFASVLFTCMAPSADGQERALNGRIYGELLPFVGLDGVRLEVRGLEGGIFNVPGVVGDPETFVTGLSRAEHQRSAHPRTDLTEAFRVGGIPLLSSDGFAAEVRPLLAVETAWSRVKPDVITVQVRIEPLEAARLLKDESRIVWSSMWGSTYSSISSGPDLATVVRSVTRGQGDPLWSSTCGLVEPANMPTSGATGRAQLKQWCAPLAAERQGVRRTRLANVITKRVYAVNVRR